MPFKEPSTAFRPNPDLHDAVAQSFQVKQPSLWHLNADSSWLLSLPYPDDALRAPGRKRFNILIDPWLRGSQSDIASWFSTQWHNIPSSVQTIDELNQVLRSGEEVEPLLTDASPSRDDLEGTGLSVLNQGNYIDAVVCSHEFTDHCHRPTLEEIDPLVPCFATPMAATLVQSWNHFKQVIEVPLFDKGFDWRATSHSSEFLPQWLGMARLVGRSDPMCFHSAITIIFDDSMTHDLQVANAVIYTAHGIRAEDVRCISFADPPINSLALLHGLHDMSIASMRQLNLGAPNGLECLRVLDARYWVGTHDEVKTTYGILGPFLRRKACSPEGVRKGKRMANGEVDLSDSGSKYVELASGEHLLLK